MSISAGPRRFADKNPRKGGAFEVASGLVLYEFGQAMCYTPRIWIPPLSLFSILCLGLPQASIKISSFWARYWAGHVEMDLTPQILSTRLGPTLMLVSLHGGPH